MQARLVEIRVWPHEMPAHGRRRPVIPRIANGMSRCRQPSPNKGRPMARTIKARAMQPEVERMSTSAMGLMSWTATLMKRNETPQIKARPTRARYGSRPRLESDTRGPIIGREHERHRTVVLDGHPHIRSKTPGLGFYSALSESLDKREVKLFGAFWIARLQQARPPAAAHVRDGRELRHDQCRSLHVLQAQVHLSGFVLDHAQVDDLVREPAHCGFIVI